MATTRLNQRHKTKPQARALAVIILAAGRSSRMGRPKLLLQWGKTSVLGHQIRTWQKLGARQIAVVCAAGDDLVAGELDRLDFPISCRISNHRPEEGMFGSICCAARWDGWLPGLTHWAITLGDQPHLRPETLRAVLCLSRNEPGKVCQPCRLGHLRHPVVFPKELFLRLGNSKVSNLKRFLGTVSDSIASCEVDDPGLDLDIDEPEDYERALALSREASEKKR